MTAELSADASGLGLGLLEILPRPIREPRRPLVAIGVGWLMAFVPSIALAALISLIFPNASQPDFPVSPAMQIFLIVILSPVVETLMMGTALLILLRFANPAIAIMISSIGWGLFHSSFHPTWGLVIWWPFLIFSTLFVTWRSRSLLAAFAIPAAVHAFQNLPPALALATGLNI